jgi:hypothetical protein
MGVHPQWNQIAYRISRNLPPQFHEADPLDFIKIDEAVAQSLNNEKQ